MTTLAISRKPGFMVGISAPPASDTGASVTRMLYNTIVSLKPSAAAWTIAFSDLQKLAASANDAPAASFALAERFLYLLPSHLPAPEIDIDSEGDVVFDWQGRSGQLCTVALAKDGRLAYALRFSDCDKEHGTKLFVDSIPSVVLDCIERANAAGAPA